MSAESHMLRTLAQNAAFSGISAVLLVLAAAWVAEQLGLPGTGTVYGTAVLLLVFALGLANIVRTRIIRRWEIMSIIAGDLAWVIGSLVLVAVFHGSLTAAGLVLVDLVAIVVLFFAVQQIRALRRLDLAA